MFGVGLGVLMATLDTSIVNISLPTLVQELHTDFATVQWVVVSYVLVLTSLMLSAGRIGDLFGKKRLYMGGLSLFSLASLLCGLAPSVGWLIAFRALQGLGAAGCQALGAAIITEVFPASERGRAMGVIGGIVSVGIALGPPLGGVLIAVAGWPSIFLVNVPIGLIALVTVSRTVPALARPSDGQRFDLAGAAFLFFTLAAYALGMTAGQNWGFADFRIAALLLAAAVGLGIFITWQAKAAQPLLFLGLFRNLLLSLNLVMGCLAFIVVASFFIMPFFLQLVLGYSTAEMGLLIMVVPLLMGVIAPLAGSLSDRLGARGISLAGLLIMAGGCLALSTVHADMGWAGYMLRAVPIGVGLGLFQAPNNSAILGSVKREDLGITGGLLALSRTLGHTTGIPLIGVLFTTLVLNFAGLAVMSDPALVPASALVAGVRGTFRITAMISLLAAGLSLAALIIDRRVRKGVQDR
ncbi:MAG: MFS transporter [Desulfarculaceae bacterium]